MSRILKICIILLLAMPASLFAQGWPLPANTQNTEVLCNPCPGYSRKDLKTVGYASPILSFTGRFLDSQRTTTYQQPFRTARAETVAINAAKNRVYMLIGSAVFAYDMNTFFTRLANHEALMSSAAIPVSGQSPHADPHEQLLKYDQYFYAENGSPWPTFIVDGQQRLFSFDWDDQGYLYLAYSTFGWGIVKDDGSDGGGIMDFIYADPKSAGEPTQIAYMKTSDGRGYVSLTGGLIYDVTDRTHPFFVRKGPTYQSFARNAAGDRIAIVDGNGQISIYTPDQFINNGSTIRTFGTGSANGFNLVTTDGTNFFGDAWSPSGNTISVIRATGATYQQTLYPVPVSVSRNPAFASGFQYGAGFLTISGISTGGWDMLIFRVDSNLVPQLVDAGGYFSHYYAAAPDSNHVVPQSFINIDDGVVVKFGTKYYVIIEAGGLGDVYEWRGADSVSANLIGSAGTRSSDPLVTGNAGLGPFYGDKVKFTSDASTASPVMLTWNFDNNETTLDPNSVANVLSGSPIIHQYSGMTPATLAARPTRTVSATNMVDSTMTGAVNVILQTPKARFGIKGTSLLFKQPDASSPAAIVAGDKFIDASDGDVEGHWTGWTLDGTLTKTIPWSATDPSYQVPVGGCGSHLLDFDVHYGPYSGAGASLATTGPDFPVSIHSLRYSVQPFAAAIDGPSTDPQNLQQNIRFSSLSRATADRTLLTSTQVTYRWDLVNSTLQDPPIVAGPADATADITAILPWSVSKSSVVPNSRVRLTLKSTAAAGGCSGINTVAAYSVPLNPPPPGMSITGGCTNGAPPCSFSIAGLPADTTGFTYQWSGSGPGNVNSTSSTAPTYSPSFSAPGDYNIGVIVSNLVGFQTLSTTTHVTRVVNCQTMNNVSVFISYTGPTSHCTITPGSTCVSNEELSMTIAPFNYQFACSSHSYTWNFGDGSAPLTVNSPAGSNSANTVTHKYTVPGTYTITCLIDNTAQQYTASQNILVGTSVAPPPPPPPPPPTNTGCATMVAGQNVFFTYHNAAGTCSELNSTPCGTGDQITFGASAFLYNFACATHSFRWDFGDGTNGTGQVVTHSYSQARTYNVTVTISNGSQSIPITQNVTVQGGGGPPPPPPPPTGACASMVANVNVFISYQNASNTCSPLNNTCVALDPINFTASAFNYNFSCATHTFSWDFGDSHTGSGQTLAHTFATPGTYNVRLTINNGSQSAVMTQAINIGSSSGVTPGASFDFNITPLTVSGTIIPNAYVFAASSNPVNAFSTFNWDFGDGSCPGGQQACSGATVTHIYPDNKNYTITLSVPGQPTTVSKTLVIRHRATGRH